MITKLSFHNYKCFKNAEFRLKALNVFSGYNGRGKSSVLQSLLLLSQSINKDGDSLTKLHLCGDLVYLGDFYEIMNDDKEDLVEFDFEFTEDSISPFQIGYEFSQTDFKVGELTKCKVHNEDFFDTVGAIDSSHSTNERNTKQIITLPQPIIKQFKHIHYISANRVGPVRFVERQEVPEFHNVGADGNRAINTLANFSDEIAKEMSVPSGEKHSNLETAVSCWISYIMSGGSVHVTGSDSTEETYKKKSDIYSLVFGDTLQTDKEFSSYNVGFGYSSILAIVVTALIAKQGSIVIVENPEAHLHPKAQSRLATLLAKLAARGVQVFVETHSEHIVNGFRLAALREETTLKHDDLSVFFFDEDFQVKSLQVESNGRIQNWPKGFFDQAQFDLAEIMRLGANKK